MKRTLLIAGLLACAPLANAVTVIVARPAIMVARPVTVAPVARPTVTSAPVHVSEPAPVTRPVTRVVTPVIIPSSGYVCDAERKLKGDCSN